MDAALLEVSNLGVDLPIDGRLQSVVRDVSLRIEPGEAMGLVGESGSGKSVTARAIMRLLPTAARVRGTVRFRGEDVASLGGAALRGFYTGGVALVFQDPRAHVNPVRTVGDFLTEALRTNLGVRRADANARAVQVLDDVGIADGRRRLRQYPHELSGGMLQRIMIAAVLLSEPQLLIADEPTTALDVTTQMEVIAILNELRVERNLTMLFITHDLDLAESICGRTAVMYAGSVVEEQPTIELHANPLHPYTEALIGSRPSITERQASLVPVGGRPLAAYEAPPGCAFAPRCSHAQERCSLVEPPLLRRNAGRVACIRVDEIRRPSALTGASHD